MSEAVPEDDVQNSLLIAPPNQPRQPAVNEFVSLAPTGAPTTKPVVNLAAELIENNNIIISELAVPHPSYYLSRKSTTEI